jgi:hypothetical protein
VFQSTLASNVTVRDHISTDSLLPKLKQIKLSNQIRSPLIANYKITEKIAEINTSATMEPRTAKHTLSKV